MAPRAIHFGAGNIGRGFIAPLLTGSGYHVTFADVDKKVIDAMNSEHSYEVVILAQRSRRLSISNVSGEMSNSQKLIDEFVLSDLVTTSVGAQILPRIAPTIAKGLKLKMKEKPDSILDVIACENGVGASETLHQEVMKHLNDEEKEWLKKHVGFANCSVDRIVPPFENPQKSDPHHQLDVGVEEFYEWVVDQDSLKSDHHVSGMKLASDLLGYVERKLFTLNLAHAMIAYLGAMKGYTLIDEAIADKQIYDMVLGALEESGQALLKKHTHFKKAEHEEYIHTIMDDRLRNPNIHDEIARICRAPKRKLAKRDRLVGPALMGQQFGVKKLGFLEKGIAAALWYDDPSDEDSKEIRESIKTNGVEKTLRDISGLKDSGPEEELVEAVLKEYDGLKAELGKRRSPSPSKI